MHRARLTGAAVRRVQHDWWHWRLLHQTSGAHTRPWYPALPERPGFVCVRAGATPTCCVAQASKVRTWRTKVKAQRSRRGLHCTESLQVR